MKIRGWAAGGKGAVRHERWRRPSVVRAAGSGDPRRARVVEERRGMGWW
jgi:hypothetical protein